MVEYLREKFGYGRYDAREEEIKRSITEVNDYHERVTNLQYFPSEGEVEFLAKNLPVQIDGDPTEKLEVSNYKMIDRVETPKIRGGFCLVMGECLAQKAGKIAKIISGLRTKGFDMSSWDFLDGFLEIQKKAKGAKESKDEKGDGKDAKKGDEENVNKVEPILTYIKDLVAGRPVLSHPSRVGGFRLRYGRSRASGLSSMSMHPATMCLLNNFIASGTQLRYERPGKASAMMPCDSIDGPIVKLKDGSVVFLRDEVEAKEVVKDVEEFLFLGDFLVNYGEFFNRAHKLIPCGYCEEWYAAELEKLAETRELGESEKLIKKIIKNPFVDVSFDEAKGLCEKFSISLHPRFIFYWKEIEKEDVLKLKKWVEKPVEPIVSGKGKEDKLVLFYDKVMGEESPKRVLELLGVPHRVVSGNVIVEGDYCKALVESLKDLREGESVLDMLNSKLRVRDKSGTFIGARMGRPEKAKLRKLTGQPHVLFPVGNEGGRLRSVQEALTKGKITSDFPIYYCGGCKRETIYYLCEECGNVAKKLYYCRECGKKISSKSCSEHGEGVSFMKKSVEIKRFMDSAFKMLQLSADERPVLIKGVRGTSSEDHIPEHLAKGILRALFGVNVNKDGSIRYDMTELPITHFRAREIGTSVRKLRELGYTKDIRGKSLESEEQLLELRPQDLILPACDEAVEDGADEVLIRVANFVDNLLVRFYGLRGFYGLKDREDLVGHLVVGLAPHTSAGIIGRIIGFSRIQGCLAHPLWHSANRRDCDGDELCVMLLMDVLLNFSRHYLPTHRGATQDAPLVISSRLVPSEVDDMVFDMDIVWKYPLEFYEAAASFKEPWDIKLERVGNRLGKENEWKGYGFTHDVKDINGGVRFSAYKKLPTMQEKLKGQMDIAEKIRAVDEGDVARLVIERHFIRDIRGNLRKFSMQQFRCVSCNMKFRRPPLRGNCVCGGNVIFTISEGGIVKYLDPALQLAEKYKVPAYIMQSLELTRRRIESIFGKDRERQEALERWF